MVQNLHNFLEIIIGCQPAKFQWCRLSGASFTDGIRKHSFDIIMTSLKDLSKTTPSTRRDGKFLQLIIVFFL